jgi:hypothetical protein
MNTEIQLYILKVINSCKTKPQLDSCFKWVQSLKMPDHSKTALLKIILIKY